MSGGFEKAVTLAAPAAGNKGFHFAVVGHFKFYLTGFSVPNDRTQWHFQDHVVAISAVTVVFTTVTSVWSLSVLAVFKAEQRPLVAVPFQDNVAAAPSVSAVRAAVSNPLGAVKVRRAWSAVS